MKRIVSFISLLLLCSYSNGQLKNRLPRLTPVPSKPPLIRNIPSNAPLAPQNPNDPKSVRAWVDQLRSAAESGTSDAQYRLADCYYIGYGVPKDIVMTYAWMNVWLATNPNRTPNVLDSLTEKMTKQQIAEGQKLSRELHAKVLANIKERVEVNQRKLSELLVNNRITWKSAGWTQFYANGRFEEDGSNEGNYTIKGNTLTVNNKGGGVFNFIFPVRKVAVGSVIKCKENRKTLTIKSIDKIREAKRPQQGDGPWSGNFVGWAKRGRVWSKIVNGGKSSLGGIGPVVGEESREVRWSGGVEATVLVKLKRGRTLILKGKVERIAPRK